MERLAALCMLLVLAPSVAARADASPARPAIVLLVLDTLRASEVSAYGEVEGTTPTLDTLAEQGLLYRHAFAPSPWTIPSHASLFTGLGVEVHRVGMPGRIELPLELETLAERLQAAGYETTALAENMVVSDHFNLLQGFETRKSSIAVMDGGNPADYVQLSAVKEVDAWLSSRKDDRPFFLFVNLIDPHTPYDIRDVNQWVPADATPEMVAMRSDAPQRQLCGGLPDPEAIAIQRGLYRGDVAAADAKVAAILARVRQHVGAGPLITVVTSDHGESFGERQLLGHEFSLHGAVIDIPLIVHGLPGAAPTTIEAPVSLVDVMPSILAWAQVAPPPDLSGEPLPLTAAAGADPEPRSIRSAYSDRLKDTPHEWQHLANDNDALRQFCSEKDPVWGGMASVIRYPYKLYWFERYPVELYDLSWDPLERSNQAKIQPEVTKKLLEEVEALVARARLETSATSDLSPAERKALQALGYLE